MNRFTKLSAEGVALPDDADRDVVAAVRINATGIVVHAAALNDGKTVEQDEVEPIAASLGTFCGHKWRAPTIEELFLIPDRSKFEPALDPVFFPFLVDAYKAENEGTWRVWSSTKDAEFPESVAWGLSLGYGHALRYGQDYQGLALAVCGPVPPASQ